MATVNYQIRSDKPNSIIYVLFSADRDTKLRRKTREFVNPENWNGKINTKGLPKNIKSGTKEFLTDHENLKSKLSNLSTFIIKEYQNRKENEIINGDWLDEVINAFYNDGKRIIELDYIDNFLEHYKTTILPFRKYRGQPITIRTQQKQITILSKFQEFLQTEKKRLKVSDYNLAVGNRFVLFLRSQNLAENTVGKYLKYTKTIFKSARQENIELNNQIDEIKGFTVETPTHYLTENELLQIQDLKLIGNPKLELTRDWLIVGCYTGQRASDLFAMNKNKIANINGKDYINLSQKKTKTPVLVPIHDEVKKILEKYNGNFPPVFSTNLDSSKTIFNNHLETVCKLANIDRLEYGRVYDKKKKHYVFGDYPFYQLVSSHVCRRTFATMYYSKIPTAIIMSVTGHKTEKEFLGYIGIDNSTLSEQMYKYWEQLEQEPKTEPQQNSKTAN